MFNDPVPDDQAGPESVPATPPRPTLRAQIGASVRDGALRTPFGGLSPVSDEALITAIEDEAEQINPIADIETIPLDQRTLSMGIDKQRSVVVAQITGVIPLTVERYRVVGESAVASQFLVVVGDETSPFSLPALVTRLDYHNRDGSSPLDDDEDMPAAG